MAKRNNRAVQYEISGRFGDNSDLMTHTYEAKSIRGAVKKAIEDGLEMPFVAVRRSEDIKYPRTDSTLTNANILTKPLSNYMN